ncbi:MAG: hypothetical protein RIM99_10925 [Cyclobacteriaceae bacterium]
MKNNIRILTLFFLIQTIWNVGAQAQDFDGARPAGSSANGINIANFYNTNIQLTAHTHSGSHGILFNSYKPSTTVSGSLGALGNTKHSQGAGAYSGGAGAIMYYGNGGTMQFLISSTSPGVATDVVWGSPKMTIKKNGFVGVGTGSPARLLHVAGSDPVLMLDATNASGDSEIFFDTKIDNGGNYNTARIIADASTGGSSPTLSFYIVDGDGSGWNRTLNIKSSDGSDPSGNVGIGTTTPTEKLEVNGTIRSKEIKVEASPWPDYVFDDNYELPSLEAIEKFVQSNGHLPEIPSAKEVEESGIALGEMNALLLKKIEELTLHIIQQEKRIQKLEIQQTEE